MASPEEKIAGLTADVKNMAGDIHDIKTLLKESSKDSKAFQDIVIQQMSQQSERLLMAETRSAANNSKIAESFDTIRENNARISKIEQQHTQWKGLVVGSYFTTAFFGWVILKFGAVLKVFL